MSLIATRVQAWRVLAPQYDKNMTRAQEYGALDFFVSQTNGGRSFLTPELIEKAHQSIGRTVSFTAINFDAGVTVSNTRSCVIADKENTSALVNITFATYFVGFTMVPALYLNNDISYQHDFSRKMEKSLRALGNSLDLAAVTALEAAKTQVFEDTLTYTKVSNSLVSPWDLRDEVIGDLQPLMRANDYSGQLHVIGNIGVDALVRKLAQHGLYNDENKQLQYANKVFHFTNNIVNESDVYATGFAVEDGNVGVLTRSGRENLMGTRANDHEWDVVNMPILNLPIDTHYYTTVGDQSKISADPAHESTADMTCNVKEHFGFMVDAAFVTSYNSSPSTIANPFIKFEIASATANPAAKPVIVVNDETNPVFTQAIVEE